MEYLSLIKKPIAAELTEYAQIFASSLSSDNDLLNQVNDHICQKTGKRMRPILVLLTAKLLGEISYHTYHSAVALELLHTASLVHDDVVDESDERRGQPSVNASFNNKVAVLVGDYLLSTSLMQVGLTHNFEIFSVVTNLGRILADGELLQLSNTRNCEMSIDVYFDIIRKKTASLFAACTKIAALSTHCSDEIVERARLFGEYIGICFQIKDDIFDYFSSEEIGKPTGNDMLEGKLTLPVLCALQSTANETMKAIAGKVKNGTATEDEISRLIAFTKENGGIEAATQSMIEYRNKAISFLDAYPESPVKTALTAYIDYVVDRKI